jgi:N-methylhydantoinase B
MNFNAYGFDKGVRFIANENIEGGFGGRPDLDGINGRNFAPALRNQPIEVMEAIFPIQVTHYELIPDSGGAGEYRGGTGVRRDYKILSENASVSVHIDRYKFSPFGLKGGKAGANSRAVLNPGPNETRIPRKDRIEVPKATVISVQTAGGGGYGDPLKRDPASVIADVLNGYVTAEKARSEHNIDVDSAKLPVSPEVARTTTREPR